MQCKTKVPTTPFQPIILQKLFPNGYRKVATRKTFKSCSHAFKVDQFSIWWRFQVFEPGNWQWQKDSFFCHLSVLEKAISRGKIQIQFFLIEFPKPAQLILGIVESHPRFQPWASFQYQSSMWLVFIFSFLLRYQSGRSG